MSLLRRRMLGSKKYTYTIISNCVGGTVYFDSESVGVIPSSGRLVVEIRNGKDSYVVSISGGVPSGSSETEYRVDAERDYFRIPADAATFWTVISSYQQNITTSYSGPGQSTVRRDSSVTMNYTSSTSEGAKYPVPCSASATQSWITYGLSGSDPLSYTLFIQVPENDTGSQRYGYIYITQNVSGGYTRSVYIWQLT